MALTITSPQKELFHVPLPPQIQICPGLPNETPNVLTWVPGEEFPQLPEIPQGIRPPFSAETEYTESVWGTTAAKISCLVAPDESAASSFQIPYQLGLYWANPIAGWGAYTLEEIPARATICYYAGIWSRSSPTEPDRDTSYVYQFNSGSEIDALQARGIAAFLLHSPPSAKKSQKGSQAAANVVFQPVMVRCRDNKWRNLISIVALRKIAAGELLFVDYGSNYWETREIKPLRFSLQGAILRDSETTEMDSKAEPKAKRSRKNTQVETPMLASKESPEETLTAQRPVVADSAPQQTQRLATTDSSQAVLTEQRQSPPLSFPPPAFFAALLTHGPLFTDSRRQQTLPPSQPTQPLPRPQSIQHDRPPPTPKTPIWELFLQMVDSPNVAEIAALKDQICALPISKKRPIKSSGIKRASDRDKYATDPLFRGYKSTRSVLSLKIKTTRDPKLQEELKQKIEKISDYWIKIKKERSIQLKQKKAGKTHS